MGGELEMTRDVPESTDAVPDNGPAIDWQALDETDGGPTDDPGQPWDTAELTDRPDPTSDHHDLLAPDAVDHLDTRREGVPVTDLHPDRLRPPTGPEQTAVAEAWERDQRPEAWIGEINSRWASDAFDGEPGHTENCADCARAVQQTWEGQPTAAGSIAAEGLPLQGGPDGGEHPAYSEQWAGRHAESASYDEVGHRVADSHGSAIVFAHGDGGHAFNALWDPDTDRVVWSDGQTGEVGPWPPDHLRQRLPDTRAIFFAEPRSPR